MWARACLRLDLGAGWPGSRPCLWLLLARREALLGRRPYRAIWLAGFLFWLAALHWLRLPHPATSIGWVALSFYLAFYVPLFVGLTRVAVHRLRLSLIVAAPVVWTGLELAKAHLMSGFTMGSLEHTQYRWPAAIPIADLAGGYGVCFAIDAGGRLLGSHGAARWPPTLTWAFVAGPTWPRWRARAMAAIACSTGIIGWGKPSPGNRWPDGAVALMIQVRGRSRSLKSQPGQIASWIYRLATRSSRLKAKK